VEIERRVDRGDRFGQEPQVPGGAVHKPSLSEPIATPITSS
jgi:hypothetical protein